MVIKILEKKLKEAQDMNNFYAKMMKENEVELIKLKEAIAECISRGVE